jgi:sporulation protein YtfJ
METTMAKLKEMVNVNTIVGDPVMITGETMVLPVSKVSLGFVSGGGEYLLGEKTPVKQAGEEMDKLEGKFPFAGAAAAGLSINPTAFLSVSGKKVRVMPAQYKDGIDRAVEMLPELIDMLERLVSGDNNKEGD